jgi:hypothetical protein
MLNTKSIDKILFLDIETVPQHETFESMPPKMQKLFEERFKTDIAAITVKGKVPLEALEQLYNLKASLYVEWAKIVCFSCGVINISNPAEYTLKTMSIIGDNDKDILTQMMAKVKAIANYTGKKSADKDKEEFAFCAHNGKVFDFPFLTKRMIINGMDIPKAFQIHNLKLWEIEHLIDTKEMWKFGVYDNNSSLSLLSATFGVDSSKDEMDGSMVKDVYYKEKNLPKIATYCEKDILALATVYLRMNGIQTKLIKS